jgi:hypothetical protein
LRLPVASSMPAVIPETTGAQAAAGRPVIRLCRNTWCRRDRTTPPNRL